MGRMLRLFGVRHFVWRLADFGIFRRGIEELYKRNMIARDHGGTSSGHAFVEDAEPEAEMLLDARSAWR